MTRGEPASVPVRDGRRPSAAASYALLGGLCGLTWASALRGWMVELARGTSEVTWLTFALLLLPGTVVGVLLGRAAYQRAAGLSSSRWLILAPVLLAAAIADPKIFEGLIHSGTGGGSLGVVLTALSAGYVLSGRGLSWTRACMAVVAAFGLLMMFFMGSMAAPISSPRGLWVALLGVSLLLLLCIASALPHPAVRLPHGWGLAAIGAVCGLAWSAALRVLMAEVVGADSRVDWGDTFGYILLPGIATGALLGWAEFTRRAGWRLSWAALAPLTFTAVLVTHFWELPQLARDGIGGGAIGVPVLCMIGGWAVAGRGRTLSRAVAALVFAAGLVTWALTTTAVGGPTFALDTAHGLWVTMLYYSLLATLAVGAAIPHRATVVPPRPRTSSRRAETRASRPTSAVMPNSA